MIGRMARGCCCSAVFLAAMVVAVIFWNGRQIKLPDLGNTAAIQSYIDSYNRALSDYSRRVDEIERDPQFRRAATEAQRHAEHVREMKQIVAAQAECEDELRKMRAPGGLEKFHAATLEYFQTLNNKCRRLAATVKQRDVPNLNEDIHRIDESAQSAAANVDKTLAQVPHYEEGKKQILQLWSQFKRDMTAAAPPTSGG